MEVVDDSNIFPTEIQGGLVTQYDDENSIKEENSNFKNLDNSQNLPSESIISAQENILNSLIDDNLNSLIDHLNSNEDEIESKKKVSRASTQTAKRPPILNQKAIKIPKPRTTSTQSTHSANKKGRISSLSAEKMLPKKLKNNPIIAKKYGIYTCDAIIPNPPRAASCSKIDQNRKIELGEIAQLILSGQKPEKGCEMEELKVAKNQLKELELDLIDKTDYMEAKKAAAAFDYIEKYINRQTNVNSLKENLEGLLSKRNELVAYINSLQETIDAQMEEQKLAFDQRLKELELQQTNEVQEFDQNVPTELTKEFMHERKDYLELRIKQRSLALRREFDEAQKLKEKADKIQKMQLKGDLAQMKKFYKRKRKLLLSKHRIQIQCLLDDNALRENEILNSRKIEMDSTKARIDAIEREVKRKCEEKNVDISELDDRIIDQNRVDNLILRSNETRYAKFRPRTVKQSNYVTLNKPLPPLSSEG